MELKKLALLLLLLTGCSNGSTSANTAIPTPAIGQWVDYGGNEPIINGNSFAFGNSNTVAGYFYTQIAPPKAGQTLTLNYSVTGTQPIWQNSPNGGDSGAPTLHLFLWRKGDDLQCGAVTKQYRMFAGRTALAVGMNQSINVALDPSQWTGCYANTDTALQMDDLLNNLLGAGFTFGGQNYAGHGIYLSSGSATFTINSFTVQ